MKKMNRIALIFTACFCGLFSVNAQTSEQFFLKDGSIVEGFISEQIPGKLITIQSEKATIVVRADSLRSKVIEYVPVESLSDEWKQWGNENKKFVDFSGAPHLELSTLQFNNVTYRNVFILEKGSIIKFIDVMPNQYRFTWGGIYRTVKQKHPVNLFSGVTETLVLADGKRVKGQIIEQFPGRDIKIFTNDKLILSFKQEQIKQILSERYNENLKLWPQIEFLDRVQLRSSDEVLEGFISSRILGKSMRFEFEDGSSRSVSMDDIVSYGKVRNPHFTPVYDRILKANEHCVNGVPAKVSLFDKKQEKLYLKETPGAQVHVGIPVCVEAKLADPNVSITIVKMHNERIRLRVNDRTRKVLVPVVTFEELVQSSIPFKRSISYLGNTNLSFTLAEKGFYMVYVKGLNKQLVINAVDY